MPPGKRLLPGILAPALMFLCACGGGGGSSRDPSSPRTNIDLAVTNFTVTPPAADPEDPLTLSGTIQNLGSETANPNQGDKFYVRFNLSTDGTFELNEQGFLQMAVTDPIPAGGSLSFSCTPPACTAPYGGGDTLSIYGNFCNSQSPDCTPPETGVIGVKVDSIDGIREVDEGNNFGFHSIEVVGTRVADTFTGCDFGLPGNFGTAPGCDLQIQDRFILIQRHRPCDTCGDATQIALPNELDSRIFASVIIRGCNKSPTCGGSWRITAVTQKPGLPADIRETVIQCFALFGQDETCSRNIEIRDPNY